MRLPVRDHTQPGESFPGYLLRIAHFNGRYKIGELLKLVGLKDNRASKFPTASSLEELSVKLAPLLETTSDYLFEHFKADVSHRWLYDDSRMIYDIQMIQPRICVECFTEVEEPTFQWEWQLLPVTHCRKHKQALLEQCPSCETPLAWHSSIFVQCQHCGLKWAEIKDESVQELPKWQNEFNILQDEPSKLKAWLTEFTRKVQEAARPNDFMHESINRFPASCTEVRPLVEAAFNETNYELEHGPAGFVSARRLKYVESIKYHCKHGDLARALNIPSGEVSHLINTGVIKPVHNCPILRDMLFDIRDADLLIRQIERVSDLPYGFIELGPDHQLLEQHATSYGRVLSEVLRIKLDIFRQSEDLCSIALDEKLLRPLLLKELQKIAGEHLPKHRVSKILKISKSRVDELVIRGKLSLCHHSSNAHLIDGSSVLKLICRNSKVVTIHQDLDA